MWLLLFIGVPAVELYLLIRVGSEIGFFYTVGIIILTGVLGWSLVKYQGLATLAKIREEMGRGAIPANEMVGGLCLLAAGIVLLTPGFLTDAAGFLLLIPPVRALLARYLIKRFKSRVVTVGAGGPFQGPFGAGGPGDRTPPPSGRVIRPQKRIPDEPSPD